MRTRGIERFAPLAGVAVLVLVVLNVALTGEVPDVDDPVEEVLSYWSEDEGKHLASAIVGALAAVAVVWFGASLRAALDRVERPPGRLASIALAGAAIIGTGILLLSTFQFAAAETAGDAPPEVTQTLSILVADGFFPIAGGTCLLLLSSGLAFLRFGVLPAWFAILTIVLGVLAVTPLGFFAFIGMVIWVAAMGIVMFRSEGQALTPRSRPVDAAPPPPA